MIKVYSEQLQKLCLFLSQVFSDQRGYTVDVKLMNRKISLKWLPFILVLASAILKLVHVNTYPIQLDEPFSIFTANLNWKEFFELFLYENNPPLHPLLVKLTMSLFGINEFLLRFQSILFCSFSIYFIYRTGVLLKNEGVGYIAGLMMLFSNEQIIYSHQIRAYALLIFLGSVALFYFVKSLQRMNNRDITWFGVLCALMMYTHFMGIVFTSFFGISLLIYLSDKPRLKLLIRGFLVAFVCYLPYLPIFLKRFLSASGGTWINPPESAMDIYYSFWSFFNQPLSTVIAIIFLLISIIMLFQTNSKIVLSFFCFILLTFFGLWGLSFRIPLYISRYLLFISPCLYLYIAMVIVWGCDFIKQPILKYAIMVLLPLLMLFSMRIDSDINKDRKQEWLTLYELNQDRPVFLYPKWERLNYTYHANRKKYYVNSKIEFEKLLIQDKIYDSNYLTNHSSQFEEIVVSSPDLSSSKEMNKVLTENYTLKEQVGSNTFIYSLKKQ